jgi:hypothetical protein
MIRNIFDVAQRSAKNGTRKCVDHECAEFWRELGGPVTPFDEASPAKFLSTEVGEFFRKSQG